MTHLNVTAKDIPLAMIGGGFGSAVGISHRDGAQMGGVFKLRAGVFSSELERGRAFGATVGVPPERCYANVDELVRCESGRADGVRLATIVTPNALHGPAAKALLLGGINVMCEKPMAISRAEAAELKLLARQRGLVFALAHAYSAYAMVHEARALVAEGAIGKIVMVQAQYASGWASLPIGKDARRGALWRTDPAQAGPSSVLGDLGTHIHHLTRFVTGLEITEVAAELSSAVVGRSVDDTAGILLRFSNGASGMMWVTMAAAGSGNELTIRVFGESGQIAWEQEIPDILTVRHVDGTVELRRRTIVPGSVSSKISRRRPGQPEGFVDAFANLYRDVALRLTALAADDVSSAPIIPDADDGVLGMAFIEAAVGSHENGGAWTAIRGVLS
ncbi:Gfo/Idh/MocA family oxidoreductase [Devosia rhodophyticola]|uniref:Gfo/Idh/MocA family oxidoreductase n=1 Tax=Devosia rhodophyticola TaxID=3026423 RepID=A0ABY7YXR6_9HYPH|nr:Gfo/Idh/MocA family oxidoreductase [Devosia rhodophyticola]WDR06007.1 Gfo/Idh/MocA family oxidoreductase [Devosia rhodophyticola]